MKEHYGLLLTSTEHMQHAGVCLRSAVIEQLKGSSLLSNCFYFSLIYINSKTWQYTIRETYPSSQMMDVNISADGSQRLTDRCCPTVTSHHRVIIINVRNKQVARKMCITDDMVFTDILKTGLYNVYLFLQMSQLILI